MEGVYTLRAKLCQLIMSLTDTLTPDHNIAKIFIKHFKKSYFF